MGKSERQAYPKAIRPRYRRASKKGKITILDEFCAVCGYQSKYATRLLNLQGRAKAKNRRGVQTGGSDQSNSERLCVKA